MQEEPFSEVVKTCQFKRTVFEVLARYDGRALNLMVCGGSVLAVLDNPAFKTLGTSMWRVFYTDERCNPDHLNYDESLRFLSHLDSENHPIPVELGKEEAVRRYRGTLASCRPTTDPGRPIDVCMLGVGENGHICSLWPDSGDLHSKDDFVGVSVDCPFSPDRVTITINFLNNAVGDLYFVIPPKNGVPKKVSAPHPSIRRLITRPSTTILPE